MKKKLVTILLATVLSMSMLCACGDDKEEEDTAAAEEVQEDSEEAEAEEAEETETETEAEDEGEAETEEAQESEGSGDGFTLLDVEESMVEVGAYGKGDDGTELVFTIFTAPNGNKYVSLFGFDNNSGGGNVICGTYESATETDDEGDEWTIFDVSDVYSGQTYRLGVCERPETQQVAFFDFDGNVVQGEFLSSADTINYMASAVNLLTQ